MLSLIVGFVVRWLIADYPRVMEINVWFQKLIILFSSSHLFRLDKNASFPYAIFQPLTRQAKFVADDILQSVIFLFFFFFFLFFRENKSW